jgi:predicted esterase
VSSPGRGPAGGTGEPDARELRVEVARSARVAALGGKAGSAGAGERPDSTWIVLHGYRQLAERFLRRFASIAGPDRLVLAPEGLSRFYLAPGDRPHGASDPVGASWMTRVDREAEIRDYVRYLDRVSAELSGAHGSREGHRTVLGFSQGAHTAARWVALGSSPLPDRLVLWGAGLPRDLPEEAAARFRRLELVRVRGEADRLRNPEEETREERRLAEWGVESPVVTHPGGHEIAAGVLAELAARERGAAG